MPLTNDIDIIKVYSATRATTNNAYKLVDIYEAEVSKTKSKFELHDFGTRGAPRTVGKLSDYLPLHTETGEIV